LIQNILSSVGDGEYAGAWRSFVGHGDDCAQDPRPQGKALVFFDGYWSKATFPFDADPVDYWFRAVDLRRDWRRWGENQRSLP